MSTERSKAEIITRLCQLINLTWYMGQIGRRTAYGDKSGPEPWYHTKKLLSKEYGNEEIDEVILLFQQVGARDDVAAAEWVVANLDDIPIQG